MSWIGLDIGGTRIKGGVLSHPEAEAPAACLVEPTRRDQSMPAFEEQLDGLIERLAAEADAPLEGIGLAMTGPVDPDVGTVYLPGKIKSLDRHRTVPYLRERWGVAVTADNDGRAACVAEWKRGAGRGVDNLVVLTLGTGIGSGVVLDGRLLTDRHWQLGTECGHFVIQEGGPLCLTGVRGTGESLASVTALVNAVRDHLARGLPSSLDALPAQQVRFPQIVEAVRAGDELACGLLARWIELFSVVLLNAFYAYAPDRLVLGGGPMQAADLLLPPLRELLNRQAFRYPLDRPIELVAASLGENAGWLGAAWLAAERQEKGLST